MVTLEQVEKLREYANVSYDEAKKALEKNEGDILQALIDLEQEGKTKSPQDGGKYVYSAADYEDSEKTESCGKSKAKSKREEPSAFRDNMNRFFKWLGEIIHKGNINLLVVQKHGENIIKLPVTVVVVLLIVGFWVVIPLLIVGLFFNFRYSFEGPDLGSDKVNRMMDNVSQAAENIKQDIKK